MPMRPKYISKINQHLDITPNVGVKFSDSPVVLKAETVSYKARPTETLSAVYKIKLPVKIKPRAAITNATACITNRSSIRL